jgi:NADH-quinone oxidoreductase subunit N
MDILILKSFLPETFLSLSILLQLVFNARFINDSKFNFPIIDSEVTSQMFFILSCLIFLFLNLIIEGVLSNFLLLSDGSTRFLKIIMVFICLLSLSMISRSFSLQNLNFFEFFNIFLLSLLSLLLLVSSYDLISFYLTIEMQTLCFYILSTFQRNSAFSTEAGLKYFISGSFISGLFLFSASILYGCLGTLNLHDIHLLLSFPISTPDITEFHLTVALSILLITITLLFKIGCAPFHFWSLDTYEGAPLSSTITFSIIPKIAILCFFVRFICSTNIFYVSMQELLLFFGFFSAFLGTFFALSQIRLKRLVIYSSVAQIGFIVIALSINSLQGFSAMYFFLFIYLITSVLIWGHITAFHNFQSRIYSFYSKPFPSLFISSLNNFFKFNNLWSFSFVVILFSVAGIPPLSGFLGKILILLELVNTSHWKLSILLILISSISVFYYIRLIKLAFFEPKKSNFHVEQSQIVSYDSSLDSLYLTFVVCLFVLMTIFFFPTGSFLLCQYIVLASDFSLL